MTGGKARDTMDMQNREGRQHRDWLNLLLYERLEREGVYVVRVRGWAYSAGKWSPRANSYTAVT